MEAMMFIRTAALAATTQRQSVWLPVRGPLSPGVTAATDLSVVCLWSVLGLALTVLSFTMGLGTDVGQALMAAG